MSAETKGENDQKVDEILAEVRYLKQNNRDSEIVILLSQVVPKIIDDNKRAQALDLYNSAKIELEKKFSTHQEIGITTLKEGIALTKLNNFRGAKQKIQQSMNVFSRLSWNLGTDLAKGALLINQREHIKFDEKRQSISPNELMEERRTLNIERIVIELIRDGMINILDNYYREGIMLYRDALPKFNKISITQRNEIENIYLHVKDIIEKSQEEKFGQLDLPLTKLFLD